jgi:hypothetical protein
MKLSEFFLWCKQCKSIERRTEQEMDDYVLNGKTIPECPSCKIKYIVAVNA